MLVCRYAVQRVDCSDCEGLGIDSVADADPVHHPAPHPPAPITPQSAQAQSACRVATTQSSVVGKRLTKTKRRQQAAETAQAKLDTAYSRVRVLELENERLVAALGSVFGCDSCEDFILHLAAAGEDDSSPGCTCFLGPPGCAEAARR